jgi:hypothetical protein
MLIKRLPAIPAFADLLTSLAARDLVAKLARGVIVEFLRIAHID